MLEVEEALQRLLAAIQPLAAEHLVLERALDRALATDLLARLTMPPVDVSAMDGYAVRARDTLDPAAWLRVTGESRAGGEVPPTVGTMEAARIFTGAPLPAGADAIAIQENAIREGDRVRFSRVTRAGEFIRLAGLDFHAGWTGLVRGTRLDPRHLGLAAAMGHARVEVARRPRVAILATGDELLAPGEQWVQGRIVSSNSTTLAALIRRWGGEPIDLGIAPDTADGLIAALDKVQGVDLVVTSGGASVGEYDLVRDVGMRRGLELDFWKIAMRPGKPLIFGRLGGVPFLGLPGNPVSATVCAIVFLRAVLGRFQGVDSVLPTRQLPIAHELHANDERRDYLRGRFVELAGRLAVATSSRQDSSMFATMALADALVVREAHAPASRTGELVTAIPIADALQLA